MNSCALNNEVKLGVTGRSLMTDGDGWSFKKMKFDIDLSGDGD